MENGVILSGDFASSLLRTRSSNMKKEALFSLLMYDFAWIPNNIKLNESKLGQNLLSEELAQTIPNSYSTNANKQIVNLLNMIAKNLIEVYQYTDSPDYYLDHTNSKFILDIELYKKRNIENEIQFDNIQYYANYSNNTINLFKDIVWHYYKKRRKSTNVNKDLLANFNIANYFPGEGDLNLSKSIKYIEGLNLQNNNPNYLYAEQVYFIDDYIKLRELLDFSRDNHMPIKTQVPLTTLSKDIKIKFTENSYRVYKIILQEIEYIPIINSIEDVLRLREDKNVKRFKEAVNTWNNVMINGDSLVEQKVRNDIRKANIELKKLNKYQKIGGWATYISLPFIIVDILSGVPVGSVLTAISGAYEFKASKLKNDYSWLLFGNGIT